MMSLRFLSLLTLVLGCTTLPPAAGFEDIRALYGERVSLVCPRICLPRRNPAGIRWTFRSKPAPSGNSTDVCIPTNDDKLIIEGVTLADEGDYHCHGVDERPSYYSSCTFQLTVQVPVLKAIMSADDGPFLKDGETILIQEDDSKSFQCYSFGAKPAATITWFLSDTPVRREVPTFSYPSHSSLGRYDTSSELKLSRVTIHEFSNKSLKCMATGAGSSTVSVTITIQVYVPLERPMIREKVNVTLSRSWRSILLTCSASNSFPPASLHWSVVEGNATVRKLFPNHRPTRDPNAFALTRKGRSLVDKDSYLCDVRATLNQADKYDVTSHLFLMVDGRDDGKGITCHASSSIAEISPLRSQATELHIKSPPINLRTNWSLEQVVEGARIAIECEAVGANPRPANFVYWVRGDNGRRAQRSNKLDGVVSTANGSSSVLVFSNVTRSDAGSYKCVADNGIGAVELSSRIYVDVIYKPSIVTKQAAYNLQHDRVNITCIAEGHPPPSIKWTNPNPLNQTEERIHGTTTIGRLSIALDRSLRKTPSEVTCIAYNILGDDTVSIAIDTISNAGHPMVTTAVTSTAKVRENELMTNFTMQELVLFVMTFSVLAFFVGALTWSARKKLKKANPTLCIRIPRRGRGNYVDMRRSPTPEAEGDEVRTHQPLRLTRSLPVGSTLPGGHRGLFFTQQSVENTYDNIPRSRASPPVPHARRRRVQSADDSFYDVPPVVRGLDTVRRVQSRRLPAIPSEFVTYDTNINAPANRDSESELESESEFEEADDVIVEAEIATTEAPSPNTVRPEVHRSASEGSDGTNPPVPVSDTKYSQSESIIREKPNYVKKLQVRRVFSV